MSVITVERKVLEKNDSIAGLLREDFRDRNIFVINLLSSPGSGKTSLIENSLQYLKNKLKVAVIEGDLQTSLDAERVEKFNVPVVQIVTNGACHLEANLVRESFKSLPETGINLLIIENVGNLVCPAGYDLGEHEKIVVLSTTEGDDKPLKYPAMFRKAGVMIINKIDLVPYTNCSLETLRKNALSINPELKIFETSCSNGKGIKEFCDWLIGKSSWNA